MTFGAHPLSPLQFGVAALPIVFASLALGLAGYVAVLEGLWLSTRTDAFLRLRSLWAKVFLGAFGMAVLALALGAANGALAVAWSAAASGFPYRPAQLLVSAFLATALGVAGVSAGRLLKVPDEVESCLALKMAIGMFVICAPLEVALSDGAGSRPQLILGVAAAAALLGVWGGLLCWRGSPERSRLFLAVCVLTAPVALLTPIAEWSGALRL